MDVAERGMDLVNASLLYAKHVARVHCPISWPEGDHCLNCHQLAPCDAFGWAFDVLADAGWSRTDIHGLDVRTGPWS